jgi:hypothetical protein
MKYIRDKISAGSYTPNMFDPFSSERVVAPLMSSLKSFNFFEEVRRIDKSKESARFA